MTGIISPPAADSLIFKATINSATLPTIATTSTVPSGKTWVAHGVCKLVEAAAYVASGVSTTAVGAEKCGVGGLSGTDGGADSGTSGGSWSANCYCAHWCAHYCARYCALAGYGYGHGYGYGAPRVLVGAGNAGARAQMERRKNARHARWETLPCW